MERMFNLDLENNIPTWFSSLLWAIAALLSYTSFESAFEQKEKRAWGFLSLTFLFLSCDEVASLHENLGLMASKYLFASKWVDALGMRLWPIALGPIVIFGLFWFTVWFKCCFRNSPHGGRQVALGTILFLAGAVGLETGMNFLMFHGFLKPFWKVEAIFEEALEMVGAILIVSGLLSHLQNKRELCQV